MAESIDKAANNARPLNFGGMLHMKFVGEFL
jgi:hypothetical protein